MSSLKVRLFVKRPYPLLPRLRVPKSPYDGDGGDGEYDGGGGGGGGKEGKEGIMRTICLRCRGRPLIPKVVCPVSSSFCSVVCLSGDCDRGDRGTEEVPFPPPAAIEGKRGEGGGENTSVPSSFPVFPCPVDTQSQRRGRRRGDWDGYSKLSSLLPSLPAWYKVYAHT